MGVDRAARSRPAAADLGNETGIGRGKRHATGVDAFMGTLATKLVLLPPKDPESKGVVERRKGWFETSFMPGRTFTSSADFNEQFSDWLALANQRVVRTVKAVGRGSRGNAAVTADPVAYWLAQPDPARS